jgi:hypothetical protein
MTTVAGVGVRIAQPPLVVSITADPAVLIDSRPPLRRNSTTFVGGLAKR